MTIGFMSQLIPSQIVYLEHIDERLYGEIIQLVPKRQRVWIRPLILKSITEAASEANLLTGVADLLWPTHLFQPALDVDMLPLLSTLQKKNDHPVIDLDGHREKDSRQRLNQFIENVWCSQMEYLS